MRTLPLGSFLVLSGHDGDSSYPHYYRGPWKILSEFSDNWSIINGSNGRVVKIGPVQMRGINYYDRAIGECERRNCLEAKKEVNREAN